MKNRIIAVFLWLGLFFCLGGVAEAQTPPAPSNSFALNAYAVALPGGKGTVAGTLAVPTWNITPSFALRETTLIASGSSLEGYFGGFNYQLPSFSKALNNASPYLNGNQFRFYVTGSAGVDHINGNQHYAFLGGGGVLYDPLGNGKFTVTLVEAQYAKLPGYANNTAIVAFGIGTTPAALVKAPVQAVKALAKKL